MTASSKIIVLLTAMIFAVGSAFGHEDVPKNGENNNNQNENSNPGQQSRVAGCSPGEAQRSLEYNNVRALIEQGGTMWEDRGQGLPAYEIPKGSGLSSIFAGSLWLGGFSPDNQLKLAAVTFRQMGNDYWPGPLTQNTAEVSESTCVAYDTFWETTRQDAESHRQYYDCLNDPDCSLEEQGLADYIQPQVFDEWPAHGNTDIGQDFYLAPFYDYNDDGFYNPTDGDYPWYDLFAEIDCETRRREDPIPLFGDKNYFWIFNDKGNIHSESQGQPIGMEVRAQAFAFATNDEINNMTFYNYQIINQGTQTLDDTFFCQWVDPDLGGAFDDYVGCDVQRGLGYCYNGQEQDEQQGGSPAYPGTPPAVGVDFFEGPYQDADGMDNPLVEDYAEAFANDGIPYGGIGIGYGDSIVDNERFGMRKFLYYNNTTNQVNGNPDAADDYYQYMTSVWKNNQAMTYGGDGTNPNTVEADYMFPGDSDPLGWGTGGEPQEPWTEVTAGNAPDDRRFLQSAGPFTLEPGDYNNITVGVVWAKANSGGPLASVELMQRADDKAQALFDNCFNIISGPDAPEVTIQEMENELILYITNDNTLSNNFQETYSQFDPAIPPTDSEGNELSMEERSYTFQGYQIYQVTDPTVTPNDLDDDSRARLIFQVDKEDDVQDLINYELDPDMELPVPRLMVDANNEGVRHTFRITEDQFAEGSSTLVNHKTYYFIVMAYGSNQYDEYMPTTRTGQDMEYLPSRKAAVGGIQVYSAIPHKVSPEAGGTNLKAEYGDQVPMTQHEGKGNGLNEIDINVGTEQEIVNNNEILSIDYVRGAGPVNVFVADPVRLVNADFELKLAPDDSDLEDAHWQLDNMTLKSQNPSDTASWRFTSTRGVNELNEEVIVDWGLSVTWLQYDETYTSSQATVGEISNYRLPLGSSIDFENPDEEWLEGIPDQDGFTPLNWIRSGTVDADDSFGTPEENYYDDYFGVAEGGPDDPDEQFESTFLNGTWAPYALVSYYDYGAEGDPEAFIGENISPTVYALSGGIVGSFEVLSNVNVVITPDRSKWTRCPVMEMQSDTALLQNEIGDEFAGKMRLRRHPSVDKNGMTLEEGGDNAEIHGQEIGMSWFPGYAVDINTGERLNMAFGEDSWLGSENGRDMLWNPSSRIAGQVPGPSGLVETFAGGQHWIYVFENAQDRLDDPSRIPAYDEGQFLYESLEVAYTDPDVPSDLIIRRNVWRACMYVGSAIIDEDFEYRAPEDGLVPGEVRIKLRVATPYEKHSPIYIDEDLDEDEGLGDSENYWNPYYTFSTKGLAPDLGSTATLDEALDDINVVPNPYYAFSEYENNRLDNRIKIVNLPEECTVTIFTVGGTMIRQYEKADPLTHLEWDLKNHRNIPIASGVYIIHVDVPDVGEKVLKWFGVMRPVDLENF